MRVGRGKEECAVVATSAATHHSRHFSPKNRITAALKQSLDFARKPQGQNFTSHRRCGEWESNSLERARGMGGESQKLTCAGTALDSKSESIHKYIT